MKELILVTGIGRSGTSFMGEFLHHLGYSFGHTSSKTHKKNKLLGVGGYFENVPLGRAVKLWNWASGGQNAWKNPFFIPIENKVRGPYPLRHLLLRIGDFFFLKSVLPYRKKEAFALKRPQALWWIWRITYLLHKNKMPKPKVIYCNRDPVKTSDSIYEKQGTSYATTIDYAEKCARQASHLQKNKRAIIPKILIVEFDECIKNPKKVIASLAEFLEKDESKVKKAFEEAFKR